MTVGKQVLDKAIKHAGEKGPECREVTLEFGKKINQQIEKIIKEHKTYALLYYIVIYAHKEVWSEQVVRTKIVIRKTRPFPEWKQCVYSYNNRTSELKYHWALPNEGIADFMLMNEAGFDRQLIEWIKKYKDGTLITPFVSI